MKLNKKHLPTFAAIVQTAQYALGGYFLIGPMGWFFVGLMGALVSFSVAYATSQVSDISAKRKAGSYVFLTVLMLFSPILIGTATFLHLTQIDNLIWRGIVSAVWGVLPDGATALAGFISGKGSFEQAPASGSRRSGAKSDGSAKASGRSKSQSKAQFTAACRYAPQCDRTFVKPTQQAANNAANAHARTCGFKPTVISLPAELKVEKPA